jgi:nucleotide-binding universal stress UspA family protein
MAEMMKQSGPGRIVVGVDGSQASKDALLWAAEEAVMTGASLDVVIAWEMPFTTYGRVIKVPGELDYSVEAERTLQDTVHEVLGASYDTELWARSAKLRTVVVEGRPVPSLLRAAEGADMLVLGGSGHGALVGTLLGSVSEHCIGRANCPVVVVHHTGGDKAA